MSWMDSHVEGDIQTALQSQSIQTALEANTSRITDAGFQSFLTNAPIPRFYTNSFNTTFPAAATTCIYGAAGLHDPYSMLNITTGFVTIPIDGYYHFHWTMFSTNAPAATAGVFYADICNANPVVARYGSTLVDAEAGIAIVLHVDALTPFRQGSKVAVVCTNTNATTITPASGSFSGTWVAPYNQYTTGPGGN